MMNGVLVERTVAEVMPALKTNSDGLKKVLDDLVSQYKTKQEELEKWKVCFHLHARITPLGALCVCVLMSSAEEE